MPRPWTVPSSIAISILVAISAAGCGANMPASTVMVEASAGPVEVARSPVPGAGAGAPDSTLSAVLGDFRRSSVTVPPDLLAEADDRCRGQPAPPDVEEIGSRPVVVSDTRGLGVVILVFADGAGASGCRVEVDPGGGMHVSQFAVTAEPDGDLERGAITLGALQYAEDGTSQRTIAVGRVGDGAVKVRAGFPDDTYVTSTMSNGWYAMWWPGAVKASVIVAADNKNVAMGTLTPP